MYFSKSVALLSVTLAAQAAAALRSTLFPCVDLGYARYEGIYNETLGINTFYGIRYAAPPTGDLRWRAALPIESHNNYTLSRAINASAPGPQCPQAPQNAQAKAFIGLLESVPSIAAAISAGIGVVERPNSEDCLLLDVIAPAKPGAKALPVIIQIHGGGYVTGNTATADGSQLVSYSKGGVIYVQIQYRLNIYGFLGAKDVLKDGSPNIGLTDQRVAMDWVQRNIHRFGGDPAQVTIMGGSAGGGSVMNHLIIDPHVPNPPFRAAISEYPWWQPYHDELVLEAQYQQLLTASGCRDLACLRHLPEDALFNATLKASELSQGTFGFGDDYYGPYVDGVVIRDLPSTEFQNGNFHKVPLLVDHDQVEGGLFQNFSISSTAATTADLEQLWPASKGNTSFFDGLYDAYQLSAFTGTYFTQPFFDSAIYHVLEQAIPTLSVAANDTQYWRIQEIFGDSFIKCPTQYMADGASTAGVKVWKLVANAGIYVHGAASVYTLAPSSASGNTTLGNYMKDWFLSFVTELDPNAAKSLVNGTRPHWPQYRKTGAKDGTVLEIKDANVAILADPDVSKRCAFLHENSRIVRN